VSEGSSSRRPRAWAVLAGGLIGGAMGWVAKGLLTSPGLGPGLGGFYLSCAVVAAVAVLALIGRARSIRRSRSGAAFLGAAGGLAAGALVVGLLAPGYQPPILSVATIEVHLDGTTSFEWRGIGECTTIENGTRIQAVQAREFAQLDGQPISLDLTLSGRDGSADDGPRLGITQAGAPHRDPPFAMRYYAGDGLALDLGKDGATGRATFVGLPLREGPPIAFPGAPTALDGWVAWSCASAP
jgi:hypothetical protein